MKAPKSLKINYNIIWFIGNPLVLGVLKDFFAIAAFTIFDPFLNNFLFNYVIFSDGSKNVFSTYIVIKSRTNLALSVG